MSRIQPANSKRAFLIPARRSQNMRGRIQRCLRFPVSRDKTRGRGRIFLATGFSILVSAFEFPARAGIWDASHFWLLDSQGKTGTPFMGCQVSTHFSIRDSPFSRHIGTGNLPYGTLLILRITLQMETGFHHYSSPHHTAPLCVRSARRRVYGAGAHARRCSVRHARLGPRGQ